MNLFPQTPFISIYSLYNIKYFNFNHSVTGPVNRLYLPSSAEASLM